MRFLIYFVFKIEEAKATHILSAINKNLITKSKFRFVMIKKNYVATRFIFFLNIMLGFKTGNEYGK